MKKNISLLFIGMSLSLGLFAQEAATTSHSVSGGLVGAANYSRFKITDRGGLPLEAKWKWGYAAGLFLNFPLGNVVSIEPQALYSIVGSKAELSGIESFDQQLGYLSVPLFIKFHLGEYVALAVGPQFDFKLSAKDKINDVSNKDDFKSTSIAGTGGIEFFPRARVTIYGRYIHGLTKIEEPSTTAPYFYNQGFQAGLKFKLFGGKKKITAPPPPPPPPVPVDSDGDGVVDSLDKCPSQAGVARYNGCPVPDSDKDGINDDEDKCPQEAGVAQYNGCPVPDSDKDGVPDSEDKCPSIAGVAENGGCPAIPEFNATNIQFVTGKSALTAASLRELTEIVDYMNKYKEIKLDVGGHTDNVGKAASNQVLSEKRAQAVKAALIKRGIASDRISATGYGMDQPIEDNSTAAGRARNRRVEFKFKQ